MPQASLRAILLALSLFATYAPAQDLATTISALTSDPAVARANWGVIVTNLDGTPIYSLNEKKLFQPASNAKLFTTAAALALLGVEPTSYGADSRYETKVLGDGVFSREGKVLTGNLVILGDGDAGLSNRAFPYVPPKPKSEGTAVGTVELQPLEKMADSVARSGLKVVVGDVVGDDTLFPWEPYPIDWSVDDLIWGYGAPVSALTINDNQMKITVKPGTAPGLPTSIVIDPDTPFYTFDSSQLQTGAAKTGIHVEIARAIGSRSVRIYGTIAVDAESDQEELAIEDPAEFAAVALKSVLERRGVVVTGVARSKHRLPKDTTGFLAQTREPIADLPNASHLMRLHGTLREALKPVCSGCEGSIPSGPGDPVQKTLATHLSPPIEQDVVLTNKVSQNLHAELLLHQLGAEIGKDGSTAQGARVIRSFVVQAGVDPNDFVFYDGSGMSGHDLVTPRAIAKLLQFATNQPWFADYKASLPIGGVDGSLEHRFTAPPLKGHVFAKTGTNSETRALSGYLECASGRTVIFSILVGNHAPGPPVDRDVMDKIVAAIAATE